MKNQKRTPLDFLEIKEDKGVAFVSKNLIEKVRVNGILTAKYVWS